MEKLPFEDVFPIKHGDTVRIQICPKKGITTNFYSKNGIGTLNPILGRGLDS